MLPLLHQFKTFSIFQIARPVFQRLRRFRIVFAHYYEWSGLRVGNILSPRFFTQLILCQWLLAGISEHFFRCWCCCYWMFSSLFPMLIHSLRVFFSPCECRSPVSPRIHSHVVTKAEEFATAVEYSVVIISKLRFFSVAHLNLSRRQSFLTSGRIHFDDSSF